MKTKQMYVADLVFYRVFKVQIERETTCMVYDINGNKFHKSSKSMQVKNTFVEARRVLIEDVTSTIKKLKSNLLYQEGLLTNILNQKPEESNEITGK